MYNNITHILLQCKAWRYYRKFDFTKSLGVRYRCVKIPQCGYMEHGLKYKVFYIQTHTNTLHSCHNFPAGSQQAARGARICETSLLDCSLWDISALLYIKQCFLCAAVTIRRLSPWDISALLYIKLSDFYVQQWELDCSLWDISALLYIKLSVFYVWQL